MKINTNIFTHHHISSSSYNLLNIPVYPSTLYHILYHNTPHHISPTSHVPSSYLVLHTSHHQFLLKSQPLHITFSFPLHAHITSYRHHMFPRSSHITPSMHTSHPTDISHITSSSSNYTLLTHHIFPLHITSPWLFKSHTQHQGTSHLPFLLTSHIPHHHILPTLLCLTSIEQTCGCFCPSLIIV